MGLRAVGIGPRARASSFALCTPAVWGTAIVFAFAAWTGDALAADPIRFDVLVAKISSEGGDLVVDERGVALHRVLVDQFRYDRLEVMSTHVFELAIDEVGRAKLPNGRELMVKPLVVDGAGVLVAVDVRGLLKTDLRMKSDHLVVIGAEGYDGGKLVISLEPHFQKP